MSNTSDLRVPDTEALLQEELPSSHLNGKIRPRSAGQQDVVTTNSIFSKANCLLFPQLEEKLHG